MLKVDYNYVETQSCSWRNDSDPTPRISGSSCFKVVSFLQKILSSSIHNNTP